MMNNNNSGGKSTKSSAFGNYSFFKASEQARQKDKEERMNSQQFQRQNIRGRSNPLTSA